MTRTATTAELSGAGTVPAMMSLTLSSRRKSWGRRPLVALVPRIDICQGAEVAFAADED
jgi:hypothetical protein